MIKEPLKDKLIEFDGWESFNKEDVQSAVKGCLEEIQENTRGLELSQFLCIKKIFRKWFEDVME